jgi:sugar phosphate isomerase/epimerase
VGPGQALESPLRAAHALRDLGVRAGGVCVQGRAASLTTHAVVLYDLGNMAIEGHVDPALAVEELGPYLRHVHVKNIAWRRLGGAWTWRHVRLDAGLVDWRDVLAALRRAGYDGRLSLGHLGGRPTLALLRREVDLLRALLPR